MTENKSKERKAGFSFAAPTARAKRQGGSPELIWGRNPGTASRRHLIKNAGLEAEEQELEPDKGRCRWCPQGAASPTTTQHLPWKCGHFTGHKYSCSYLLELLGSLHPRVNACSSLRSEAHCLTTHLCIACLPKGPCLQGLAPQIFHCWFLESGQTPP